MKTRRGCLLKRKTGWLCQTVNNDGKRVSQLMRNEDGTPCKTKDDAKAARVEFMRLFTATDKAESIATLSARMEGVKAEITELEETEHPPLAIDAAWEAYEQSARRPDSGEATMRVYQDSVKAFKKWLTDEKIGTVSLRDVTPDMAGRFAHSLSDKSASTFNQRIGFLRLLWTALSAEIKGGGVNPWAGIARRKLQSLANRKRPLTPEQFTAIMAAASSDPDLKDLLTVLAWTGQRLVDALKLRWEAVSFRGKVLTLYPQKTARRTGKAVYVPILPALLDVLNRRHATLPHTAAAAYVFPQLVEDFERDPPSISKRIQAVFVAAGIETSAKRDNLKRAVVLYGAHSFRHLFVTTAAAEGLPAAMIKAITGHTSDAMSEHYQQFDAKIASEFAKRLTGKPAGALPAGREPMPPWVREGLGKMTPENWKAVREEMLKPVDLVKEGSKK